MDPKEFEERLIRLEFAINNHTKQLEKILTNDLPHLHRAIKWCSTKMNFILAFLGITLALVALSVTLIAMHIM